jgi:hypothetical protein
MYNFKANYPMISTKRYKTLTKSMARNITEFMARPRKNGPQVDWSAVYVDWATGEYSNRQIAVKHGVSATSIGRKAKEDGWSTTNGPAPEPTLTEPEPVVDVVETKSARKGKPDVSKSMTPEQLRKRTKDLAQRLLAEVEDITTYESEIAEIIMKEETDPMRRRAALKAISVGERIKMAKEITAIIDGVDPKRKVTKTTDKDAAEKPEGKKAQKQAEAEKIAAGRFAPRSGPKLVVNG